MTEHVEKQEVEATETMMDAMNSVQEVNIGDIVKGEILKIQDNKQAIVGIIGGGVEGVIPFNELSASPFENVTDIVNVGDVVDLVVIKPIMDKENGSFLLSKRRIDAKKVWEDIQKDFENGTIIEAPVTDAVKGGLVVDAGVRGFVPASMVDAHFVDDFSVYKGQTLRFKIVEIEPSENRLILSHKAVVEAEKEVAKKEVLAKLVEGDTVTGTVARLTNFGAFIDLGGVDGLVHISQISYDHVKNPADVLTVGDSVEVKILSIDTETGRISLSIKDTQPGPWDNIEERAAVGTTLTGTVKRLTSFGAFVEVYPGVEGLVHISQISHNHIATPHEVLHEGDEIKVKVLDVNPGDQRLSLSIKALQEKLAGLKEKEEVVDYELPEEDTGFTLGDILGEQLSDMTTEDDQ
ncbi:30S ribosomal protein S1 [Carnobacterium divergens]|uniref:30S ribosomal protein S1 n=1 Tax=Carnobacterium divergens TaxID=2748 RepID=UPI00107206CE|nr:30S ribosomal protein S1 [Carnobacterium divergens]TFJ38647.1 30S ribosomal protein S1 [Carnobacterium divergens]TFJ47881.1 30S ribosomal protein S1 [Carnobacterium divergens]TFJ52845.1 30S ribosomal protein S1 [Carnobacterium divergens]TFJ58570.1 30S ribosomal protein S1 [Carnobacterium divergens]TFJ68635.1 30S ribosomal protein S1 [Carnobacterium divergens]